MIGRRSWIAWLAIVFGAAWAVSNAQDIDTVAETRHWETTPGTMVASSIVTEAVGTYLGRTGNRTMRGNRLHLTYAYTVDTTKYTGSQWSALPPSTWPATHAMLRKYPAGGGVVVHYDPHDPTQSVLDTSWPIGRYLQLACALLLMGGTWAATRPHRRTTSS